MPRQCVTTRSSSFGCYQLLPTVLATSRHGLLQAYKGEAGMLKYNWFESVSLSAAIHRLVVIEAV